MSRKFTIGRDLAGDIVIADDSVSRTHAELWLAADGSLMLADRGSSNGTDLIRAGKTVPLAETALQPGDQVRFGEITLSAKDLIEAIEAKHPGALSGPAPPKPATPPPIPKQAGPPPPPAGPPPPPPLPRPAAAPPPLPSPAPAGGLVRCECGAIKTLGQVCPGCHK